MKQRCVERHRFLNFSSQNFKKRVIAFMFQRHYHFHPFGVENCMYSLSDTAWTLETLFMKKAFE